jgi:isopenicillin N synthase-like dioxygenase
MPIAAIEPLSIATRDEAAFAGAIGRSFERYGFAVVADHAIDQALIDAAFDRTRRLFFLPEPVKRNFHVPGGAGQRGYTPFGVETAKGAPRPDLKEFWHVGRRLAPNHRLASTMPVNVPMPEIPDFDSVTYGLFEALDGLGLRILRAVAQHLDLAPNFFDAVVADGNSILRLLHYPPVAAGTKGVRAGAHEDINVITLLLGAEESGLQILDRDGRWLAIDPPPGCVVVNIGDMLQRLTNHVLPSTTHRVVNPTPERAPFSRYSMPFFQHFASDFLLATLAGCISPSRPNRYPTPCSPSATMRQVEVVC